MPKATVSTEAEHFDLKTLPGGYVEIRRMPYGKYLTRQEMALRLKVQAQQKQQQFEGEMAMANKAVTVFEFKECVVSHNLEDEAGQLLNFTLPHTLELLDPKVGDEIGTYINQMHQFDSGNLNSGSVEVSSDPVPVIPIPTSAT